MDAPLDEQYLNWLYARIGSLRETRQTETYWLLLRRLYITEFIWLIPNDDNRVEDGRELRYEFLDEAQPDSVDREWMRMGCSVLELIMGLAKRLSFEADRTPHYWFWKLIENLGLHIYNDREYDERSVDTIVGNLIWRTYFPDGHGGLFPLRNPRTDQRDVEIWYQLCAYILELD